MTDLPVLLLIAATLGSGLMAGLFGAFSTFLMKSLAALPAPGGIAAMQSINLLIVRPSFLLVFFGTAACGLAACFTGWSDFTALTRALALAGSLVYLVGCLGVTVAFSVPLNDRLAPVDPESAEGAVMWEFYLSRWTRWNHVRAVATVVSTVLLILSVAV